MSLGTLNITDITSSSVKINFNKDSSYKVIQIFKADSVAGDFDWNKEPATARGYNVGASGDFAVSFFPYYTDATLTSTIFDDGTIFRDALNNIISNYTNGGVNPSNWYSVSVDVIAFRIFKWVAETIGYASDVSPGNWKFPTETIQDNYGDCEDTSILTAALITAALTDSLRENPLSEEQVSNMVRMVIGYVNWDGDNLWNDGHAWVIFKSGVLDYHDISASGVWRLLETTLLNVPAPAGGSISFTQMSDIPRMIDTIAAYSPLFNFRVKMTSDLGEYDGVWAIDTSFDPNNYFGILGRGKDSGEYAIKDNILYSGFATLDIGNNVYPEWWTFYAGTYLTGYKHEVMPKRFCTPVNISLLNEDIWVLPVGGAAPWRNLLPGELLNAGQGFVSLSSLFAAVKLKVTFNSVGYDVTDEGSFYSFVDQNLKQNTTYYYRHVGYTDFYPKNGKTAFSPVVTATTAATDLIPPRNVLNFTVSPGNAANLLRWENPADTDFAGVLIKYSLLAYPNISTGNELARLTHGETTYMDQPLTNSQTVYYTIFSFDAVGNYSSGVSNGGTPELSLDIVPPEPPTGLTAMAGDGYVDLSWTSSVNTEGDLSGYRIYVSTDNVNWGTNYPVYDDGNFVYVTLLTTSFRVVSLVNATQYFFKVTAVDVMAPPNESEGAVVTATPQVLSDAPKQPTIILRDPTNRLDPPYVFDFIDTPDDSMTGFELELSDVHDFSRIIHKQVYDIGDASYISNIQSPEMASAFSGWKGFPPGSVTSGLSATWYSYAISGLTLTEGSYFLRIRTRDTDARYSVFGVATFVIDTSVMGVQVIVRGGDIVNNKNIQLELRAPEDTREYILSEDPGFSDSSLGMMDFSVFVPDGTAQSHTFIVRITGSGFVPATVSVNKGDTVRWVNESISNVVIVSGRFDGVQKVPDGLFNSEDILPGHTFEYTFNDNGSFSYYNDIDYTKQGEVDVFNYTDVKLLDWTLSRGSGAKTLYAQFKDAIGNESSVVTAIVIVAIPDLVRPLMNENVKSTLPTLEWSVPISTNGNKVHFKVEIDVSSDFNSNSGQPLISVETSKHPGKFRYRESIDNIWIPFPVSGVASGVGSVAYVVDQDLSVSSQYYWRVQAGM